MNRPPAAAQAAAPTDPGLRTPLYHQVYLVLRSKIADGTYAGGSRMPPEHELCRMFGVSRITVRRALDELASAGLIRRRHGSGTLVEGGARPTAPQRVPIEGMLENLIAMGLRTEVRLLECDWVAAGPDVAAALDVAPGSPVQRAVRVRSSEEGPFSHLTTWLPERVGRSIDPAELASQPLLVLLERAGVRVDGAEQTIGATLADTVVAPRLGVEVGWPLLSITRTVRDAGGGAVEHLQALYRPDRYQYRMSLDRVRAGGGNMWSPRPGGPGG
jgi:GntR family transcriptional regulator